MRSWPQFKALWTHRYRKYSHIGRKYLLFFRDYLYFSLLKLRLGRRKLVAIVLSEQMGDIIACEPVSREVRRRHPDDHIVWVVRKSFQDLVRHNPHLDSFTVEYCVSHRIKLLASKVFDQVYNLHLSHRNCTYCGDDHVNPRAEALDLTYANYYFHGDLLSVFSRAAGLPALDDQPRVYIPDEARQRVDGLQLPEEAIVVHCQSSYAPRDWQVAHWNRLINWMLATYPYPIIEVGLQSNLSVSHPRYHNLCGQLSILETADVIRRARLYIGIDSGPAHFANALGAPGIILLGRTAAFDTYMPYSGRYKHGQGVTILNHLGHPCSELPYEWVERAVAEQLNKAFAHEPKV